MNSHVFAHSCRRWARCIAALSAGIFLISTTPARPAPDPGRGRFLLIFDTSSAMKPRKAATQYAVKRLFFAMMNGQLQPGDSIGVWTFNRKLRAGDFPLQHWLPQNAALLASNIAHFVQHQRYSRSTRFQTIMPDINRLVRSSRRLTVLIFCDGEGRIKGTPFDDAINQSFKQNERALRKARQTFIVVLRSQLGHYTGYTMNSSAVGVSFPEFPPLPPPPQPVPPPVTNSPPAAPPSNAPPAVELPPLVIVGTNVSTNLIPAMPPHTQSSQTTPVKAPASPPPARAASNAPPATAAATHATNATHALPPPVANTSTNAPPPPPANSNSSGLTRTGAMAIGGGLLVAAVGLILVARVRSRQSGRGSLISDAMKKK